MAAIDMNEIKLSTGILTSFQHHYQHQSKINDVKQYAKTVETDRYVSLMHGVYYSIWYGIILLLLSLLQC